MDNFYILADLFCYKFSDKIHDCKDCTYYEDIEPEKNQIKELLQDEDKKLVDTLSYSITECYKEKNVYNIADALNFGIKLGMELQEYFHSLSE
ncbi:MAG: hypothetical protein IJ415_04605 [Clostridia bacterium]|nr:hypothetical protein [Clostridia bacterium]